SWTNISSGLPKRWVTHVTADPLSAGTAYVTLSGYRYHDNTSHIYKTVNYGSTWIDIGFNLPSAPVNDVIVDSVNNSTLYVATDVGVYYTTGGNNTWIPLGQGLPLVPVMDLTLHNPTHTLVAATYGRSMYSLDLNQLPLSVKPLAENLKITVYPNPISETATIKTEGMPGKELDFELYDIKGVQVRKMELHEIETKFNKQDLLSGTYFYRIKNSDKVIYSGKMIII
ncbi:MAG TPA: T9SS type A sorting domain-containing protein, partial [Bacteroidia bacterium]|nr:T9SS type A sorting domain-containing protein [Bacteroidia bacterium]